ncbi:hypothetical protein HN371_26705 [Candidatus Poribacteria bacterium]|nr:hypothetical protein [Candidatus Poribacteria bacterium]MBT5533635.1 hypothetical protein [Candidatus Poribacteria bacterium]MBT5709544.1 hypothetical protein [Candidatus Poribacteria bacterium]MBT7097831.1 hypothetical protein [Candidatus Poribacteria bacterium]MBT7805945.1 hypothetical protein [Candidatus Poribacteria bacterium]
MDATRDFDGVAANTYTGPPTLTDTQVLEVCREGYLMLPGIVSEDVNARTLAYMAEATSHEPSAIILEDWFREGVLLAPEVAGAVRSLLGAGFGLPVLMSSHRADRPLEAQGWHHDADSVFGQELNYLQVFYYPQDTPDEMGPTEVLPRSHIAETRRDIDWTGGVSTASPPGTVFITMYPILHRRAKATGTGVRHLLKYNYWRTTSPRRDWVIEPDFDLRGANYGGHHQAWWIARMFYWLCGDAERFSTVGGQGWPYSGSQQNQIGPSYGFPGPPRPDQQG